MLQTSKSQAPTQNEHGLSKKTMDLFEAKKALNAFLLNLGSIDSGDGYDGTGAAFRAGDSLMRHIDDLLADSINDDVAGSTECQTLKIA